MPWVQTANIIPGQFNAKQQLQVYNGLDCCVTLEVFEELKAGPCQAKGLAGWNTIYQFERALQAPYLEIMQRGFAIDEIGRRQAAAELRVRIEALRNTLNEFASEIWDRPLNPRSPTQLKEFFYSAMRLPEVWLSQKGERKLSTNREALEKLEHYLHARPFTNCILAIRDLSKQLEVFETEIDADGRFRASYNIAGTETGRPSSSSNAFGTGGNAQNISPALRYVFQADPGYKLCVIDLEQVEARDVGFFCGCLFDDWKFLDNCESGDLHTNNSKLVWPGLSWTGDPKKDRKIADRTFYREFSYRDMSKRGGHLSNYYGTAWTMGRSLKIPQLVAEEFRYVRGGTLPSGEIVEPAFPAIAKFWQWTAEQLQTTHMLINPFGRRRHFFGRPGDDTTLREAIAYLPQSTTAERMNLGLWRTWRHVPEVELLAETYDSITFQFRDNLDPDDVIGRVLEQLAVELVAPNGRRYVVPAEAKLGYNWGAEVTQEDRQRAITAGKRPPRLNLGGLRKWKPGHPDIRVRANGLQRTMDG
jgi:hypothetical protein